MRGLGLCLNEMCVWGLLTVVYSVITVGRDSLEPLKQGKVTSHSTEPRFTAYDSPHPLQTSTQTVYHYANDWGVFYGGALCMLCMPRMLCSEVGSRLQPCVHPRPMQLKP